MILIPYCYALCQMKYYHTIPSEILILIIPHQILHKNIHLVFHLFQHTARRARSNTIVYNRNAGSKRVVLDN